jgi:hypothetical protein
LGTRYLDVNPKSLTQNNEATDLGEINVLSGAFMFFKKKFLIL